MKAAAQPDSRRNLTERASHPICKTEEWVCMFWKTNKTKYYTLFSYTLVSKQKKIMKHAKKQEHVTRTQENHS